MTDKIVVLTTCDSREAAEKVARGVLEARLAACVNILPGVASLYWWKDKIEEAAEWLLVVKSSRAHFEKLRDQIVRLHPYDVPEVVALPIVDGAEKYLDWIEQELRAAADT